MPFGIERKDKYSTKCQRNQILLLPLRIVEQNNSKVCSMFMHGLEKNKEQHHISLKNFFSKFLLLSQKSEAKFYKEKPDKTVVVMPTGNILRRQGLQNLR